MRQFRKSIKPYEGILPGLGSNWDLWWRVQKYHGRDCDLFGNKSERQRELRVHLGESPNQEGNHKETPEYDWVLMGLDSEDDKCDQRLSACTEAINFPQRWIWNMG